MEYYRRPRQTKPAEQATRERTRGSSHSRRIDLSTAEQSIYIFPNPPSAPPSPNPDPANASGAPLNLLDIPRSRSISLATETTDLGWDPLDIRSPSDSAISVSEVSGGGVWEWPASAEGSINESEVLLEESIMGASRWDLRRPSPQQFFPTSPLAVRASRSSTQDIFSGRSSWPRSRTASTASSLSSVVATPVPRQEPRFHIPLLSFVASLFGIDESTLRLISYTPPDSIIFPGLAVDCATEYPDSSRRHGSLALLADQKEGATLKEGIRAACDSSIIRFNPFGLGSLPLSGLFRMVKGIYSQDDHTPRDVR